ncbi:unnamed protein product [Leptosia nina]|uniref:FLYWCH-type domain-containing protein n=1 Tax=Leptosia nina TaxID=320188 RepID=A0AAV1J7D3_9NEOP
MCLLRCRPPPWNARLFDPLFGHSRAGKPVLILGHHRFNYQNLGDDKWKKLWRCDQWSKVTYGVSQRGNPILMVGQNRFKKTSGYGQKSWWHCIKRSTTSCPASISLHGNFIVKANNLHNHQHISTNMFHLMRAILRARFCRDSTNIYIGGHKFFRHSRSLLGNRIRWTCAKKHKLKCKASAVTIDGVVVSTTGLHSHN